MYRIDQSEQNLPFGNDDKPRKINVTSLAKAIISCRQKENIAILLHRCTNVYINKLMVLAHLMWI